MPQLTEGAAMIGGRQHARHPHALLIQLSRLNEVALRFGHVPEAVERAGQDLLGPDPWIEGPGLLEGCPCPCQVSLELFESSPVVNCRHEEPAVAPLAE